MASHSAGILLYRRTPSGLEVLLLHPGGPFWAKKDVHAWTIPKGLIEPAESPQAAALREFQEETGVAASRDLAALGDIVQSGGKRVTAFACESEFDTAQLRSNLFELEWPPRSGRTSLFPEIDRAEWFTLPMAREKILISQAALLDRLITLAGKD